MLDFFEEHGASIAVVTTFEAAAALCNELRRAPYVSFDTEWVGYDDTRTNVNNGVPFCATFAWRDGGAVRMAYVHNYLECEGLLHGLAPFFRDKLVPKIAHNAAVDVHILANMGIRCENACYDTMVADHLLDERRENQHGLKDCAADFLFHARYGFNETFGERKRNKDGSLSAAGGYVVPSLGEYVMGTACPSPVDGASPEVRERWMTLIGYAVADAYDGLLLYEYYVTELAKIPRTANTTLADYFFQTSSPLVDLVTRMERHGMPLDLERLRRNQVRAEEDLERTEAAIFEWAGALFKIGSKKVLGKLLHGEGPQEIVVEELLENPTPHRKKRKVPRVIMGRGYPVLRTTDGGDPSMRAEHLRELHRFLRRSPVWKGEDLSGLDALLMWSKIDKQLSTYLRGLQTLQIRGRVHGRINLIGTTSHRWSSSNPNLQNITTGEKDLYEIRAAFTALPGYEMIVADYSQLEYRLLAHFSQEPKLIQLFFEGWDLHSLTCYNIYPRVKRAVDEKFGGLSTEGLTWVAEEFPDDRKRAKTLNFEIIYGVGYRKLADQLEIPELAAKAMIDGWFAGYPYVKAWMNRTVRSCQEGRPIRLLDGALRRPNKGRLMSKDYGVRGEEERTLINAGIQGSAAAVVKKAMLRLDADRRLRVAGFRQIMQVHDEIVGLAPAANVDLCKAIMRPIMEQPFSSPLRVPLPVAIGSGPNWAEAKV